MMSRSEREQDPQRETRIAMEIVVDAYGPEEQALGWYCHLENNLTFPFTARCFRARAISPLTVGEEVEIVGLPPEEECEREMFVTVHFHGRPLAVPLAQLEFVRAETGGVETEEAINDWHYWVERGYEF